ncbi:hypothetical protein Clacol_002129 [Clathrus columnatus]|uniref:Uncharacterized protein n=1 Tax=Clathrus columnatus TaxID=1419009 RepID=A0AAV5A361_9AGAM|nr:hypothetical protein Clacol_002129 [Clathrus columnatus]
MDSLHRICPNLRKISIVASEDLPFRAIRPLLKCLTLVEMISQEDVDIELEDMVTITTNRSSWQVIHLPSVKPLSYQAMVPFARNCPHLYKLRLALDSKLGIPDPNVLDVKFSSLASLIVGFSEPTSDFQLALFLSKICSKPIEITPYSLIPENHRLWKTVEKLVNFILTTQLENQRLKDENIITTHVCRFNVNKTEVMPDELSKRIIVPDGDETEEFQSS